MDDKKIEARREIDESFKLCLFSMKFIGLSFTKPASNEAYLVQKMIVLISVCSICYHVFSEVMNIIFTFANSPKVEEVVPLFHVLGYGALSIFKMSVMWYQKDVFNRLIEELSSIWPMPPMNEESQRIKEKSLSALRVRHLGYYYVNLYGVWFYNITPIFVFLHERFQGMETKFGFVWTSWYPFDKHQPFAHFMVYLFEIYAGVTCVWIMVASDLLFSGLASHIGLLLRILQRQLESLGTTRKTEDEQYNDIKSSIKLHQRLISYCMSIEEAFSFVNLINISMSSVNICCVVFVIVLLEPMMSVSNKLFLMSQLLQTGVLCWYADDIINANARIAVGAYNSRWYEMSPRCRRALRFLILRAQKPIAFTAMKFTNISLVTYSSILMRSYSYFTLLYTMYRDG
ncbi:odorant receptor 4-like [Aricia agestis]|uniref:odorant receptor 4-like n=1 Tax=Aricia agestis TaxID=91739 RepID=UPI001C20A3C9|nr:odorant receptor 4-like [Aricia agestis]